MGSLAAWVALSLIRGVGARTLKTLIAEYNGDLEAVLHADTESLRQVRGIGPKISQAIQTINLAQVEARLTRWQAAGVDVITLHDTRYPSRLRALDDAPPTLFKRGTLSLSPHHKMLAIIGTRTPTPAAHALTLSVASAAAESGWTVISGLALGVDAAAHMAASACGALQCAVLGSGVLRPYPPENNGLAQAIMAHGALWCEVAPDAPVSPSGLVARNRIISGLADAVVVVESGVEGGAMHAARFARAQGRPIFTFDLEASGNQALIAAGAAVLLPDAPHVPL